MNDVQSIVDGDDTDETVLRIDDGECHETVLRHQLRRRFLIFQCPDGNDVLLHQIRDRCIRLREEQVLRRDDTEQVPVIVCDVTGIDCLFIDADAPDFPDSVPHGHVLFQPDKLGRHDAAGAVGRVLQKLVDRASVVRGAVCDDTLHHVGGHLLDHIDGIIEEHFVKNVFQFLIGKGRDERLLQIGVHLGKHVRRLFLMEQAEKARMVLLGEFKKQFRDILDLHIAEFRAEFPDLPFVHEFDDLVGREHVLFVHRSSLLCHGCGRVASERKKSNATKPRRCSQPTKRQARIQPVAICVLSSRM